MEAVCGMVRIFSGIAQCISKQAAQVKFGFSHTLDRKLVPMIINCKIARLIIKRDANILLLPALIY